MKKTPHILRIVSSVIVFLFTLNFFLLNIAGIVRAAVVDTPSSFTATNGDTSNTLSWDEVSGVDGYRVYRGTNSDSEDMSLLEDITLGELSDSSNPSFVDTTASTGQTYYYVVTAYNGSDESDPSLPDGARRNGIPGQLFRDDFNTNESSPLTSPRTADPGPGNPVIFQTGGGVSIQNGWLHMASSTGDVYGWGRKIYVDQTPRERSAGLVFMYDYNLTALGSNNPESILGWTTSTTTNITSVNDSKIKGGLTLMNGTNRYHPGGVDLPFIATGTVAVILRSIGTTVAVKPANDANFYTLWVDDTTNTGTTLYPRIEKAVATTTIAIDNVRIAQLPSPWNNDDGPVLYSSSTPSSGITATGDTSGGFIQFTWVPQSSEILEIAVRYQDDDNRIVARANQSAGTVSIVQINNGVETVLDSGSQTFTPGQTYRIKILHRENFLTGNGYVNQIYVGGIVNVYVNDIRRASKNSNVTFLAGNNTVKITGFTQGSDFKIWPGSYSGAALEALTGVPDNTIVSVHREPFPTYALEINSHDAELDLSDYFSDPDGDMINLSIRNNSNAVSATLVGSILTLSPLAVATTTPPTITVVADDGINDPVTRSFEVPVYPDLSDVIGVLAWGGERVITEAQPKNIYMMVEDSLASFTVNRATTTVESLWQLPPSMRSLISLAETGEDQNILLTYNPGDYIQNPDGTNYVKSGGGNFNSPFMHTAVGTWRDLWTDELALFSSLGAPNIRWGLLDVEVLAPIYPMTVEYATALASDPRVTGNEPLAGTTTVSLQDLMQKGGYSVNDLISSAAARDFYTSQVRTWILAIAMRGAFTETLKTHSPDIEVANYAHAGFNSTYPLYDLNAGAYYTNDPALAIPGDMSGNHLYGWLGAMANSTTLRGDSKAYGLHPFGIVKWITKMGRHAYIQYGKDWTAWIGYKSWEADSVGHVHFHDSDYYEAHVAQLMANLPSFLQYFNPISNPTYNVGMNSTTTDARVLDTIVSYMQDRGINRTCSVIDPAGSTFVDFGDTLVVTGVECPGRDDQYVVTVPKFVQGISGIPSQNLTTGFYVDDYDNDKDGNVDRVEVYVNGALAETVTVDGYTPQLGSSTFIYSVPADSTVSFVPLVTPTITLKGTNTSSSTPFKSQTHVTPGNVFALTANINAAGETPLKVEYYERNGGVMTKIGESTNSGTSYDGVNYTAPSSSRWLVARLITDEGSYDSAAMLVRTSGNTNLYPWSRFTVSTSSLSVTFTNNSVDYDGSIVSYDWDFGDGETSADESPTHTYSAAGDYIVTLTTEDNTGATQSATSTITVTESLDDDEDDETPDITQSPGKSGSSRKRVGKLVNSQSGVYTAFATTTTNILPITNCPPGYTCTPIPNYVPPVTPTFPNVSTSTTTYTFTRNLTIGSTGEDVRNLQKYLNAKGFIVSPTDGGSPGNETMYFGEKTRDALARFQAANNINPSQGFFGPVTRAMIERMR